MTTTMIFYLYKNMILNERKKEEKKQKLYNPGFTELFFFLYISEISYA